MRNRLSPRYARYGLLANFALRTLKELRQQEELGIEARPSGDDEKRLLRLQELLAASWQGGVVGGSIKTGGARVSAATEARLSKVVPRSGGYSTRSKLDDAKIVQRLLPPSYELGTFVPKADETLRQLTKKGIAGVKDKEFLFGPMTDFLARLAKSNRGARPSTRRAGRQRVPLA